MTKGKKEPVVELRSKVRGVTFPEPRTGISRQKIIKRYVKKGTRLWPVVEPNNPVDVNAVGLWVTGGCLVLWRHYHIGYLVKKRAETVAFLLREKEPVEIIVSSVTGSTRQKQTRGVNIVIRY